MSINEAHSRAVSAVHTLADEADTLAKENRELKAQLEWAKCPPLKAMVEHSIEKVARAFVGSALASIARDLGVSAAMAGEHQLRDVEPVLRALARPMRDALTVRMREDCLENCTDRISVTVPTLCVQALVPHYERYNHAGR